MRPEPRLFIAFDTEDDLGHQRFVAALHSLARGRLVCEIPLGSRGRFIGVADEVFEALGKDLDLAGAGRSSAESWRQLVIWLVGEGVRDIFVGRAQHLDRRQMELLFTLTAAADARLWLIAQSRPLSRGLRELLCQWPVQELEFEDFRALWLGAEIDAERADGDVPEPRVGFPDVPDTEFPRFRARCRELLEPADFAVVDQVYVQAFAAVDGWRIGGREDALEALADTLAGAGSIGETVVRVRAAQAALLRRGWWVWADLARLKLWASEQQQRSWSAAVAQGLRRYAHPRRAGAAALSLLADLRPAQLAELRIDEVRIDVDRNRMVLAGTEVSLPADATGLVRALLAQRAMDGASAEEPLLVSGWRENLNPATAKTVRLWLRKMTRETGLPLARSWNSTAREPERLQLGRAGLKVGAL